MNYHLSLLINEHKEKIIAYHVGNPNPCLGQAQKCGGFKTVNRIPNLPSRKLDLQWKYMYIQTIKNMHRLPSTQNDHIIYKDLYNPPPPLLASPH